MKIAVTYENGEVFQHFGHTEQFKVYEVEDGRVVSSRIVGSDGSGHSALASMLSGKSIDVLICGGIGGGAQAALEEAGIELCAGASGSADEAVEAYLRGELVNTGANCDHHDQECSCGEHEDQAGGCGEGCECGEDCEGDCAGCGGSPITGKNVGKTCRVHYRGTFNDGTEFDSSYDRNEPLEFICGVGQMIEGFDRAVADMEVGQEVDIHLAPSEAYGEADPDAILTVKRERLHGAEHLTVGQRIHLRNQYGQPFPAQVTAIDDQSITFDANHPMAGKDLNFHIELVSCE